MDTIRYSDLPPQHRTALAWFAKLWKRVCGRSGRLVLCNLGQQTADIFRISRLDVLLLTFPSREEAVAAVS